MGSIPIGHPNVAPVAQLDRALASEAKGRRFDSCRAHHLETMFAVAFVLRAGGLGR